MLVIQFDAYRDNNTAGGFCEKVWKFDVVVEKFLFGDGSGGGHGTSGSV